MATIKASCRTDGDVELFADDVTVVQVDYSDRVREPSYSYRFRCPVCSMVEIKPTEPRVVDLLAATGVTIEKISLSEDVDWDIINGNMGRLTEAEVIDLTIDLQNGDTPQSQL